MMTSDLNTMQIQQLTNVVDSVPINS